MPNLYMKFPEGRGKVLTFSYDDGVSQDKKLIEIFNRYGMKSTFNINSAGPDELDLSPHPSRVHLDENEVRELYIPSGHEVALHTFSHPFPHLIPSAQMAYEVVINRKALESCLGKIITGMAYPMGTYNEETLNTLRSCGISYCRTIQSTGTFEYPPKNWLTLHPTAHHGDKNLMTLASKFLSIDASLSKSNYMFYIWGHSYEFDERGGWDTIEAFCKETSGKSDVWYATNIEIYNYQKAFDSLERSLDDTCIHNPTCVDVWGVYKRKLVKIGAGETVLLK